MVPSLMACGHTQAQAVELTTSPTPRTVSVTGTATTRVVPDTVIWQVTTTSTHAKLEEAKRLSDTQMTAILKTVKKLGVADADMQTGTLHVAKDYERGKYGTPGAFRFFKVTRQITIKERDISAFDRFLTGLVSSADLEVSYSLTTSAIERIRRETRLMAVKAAKEKAVAMLGVLGEDLGRVITISSGKNSRPTLRARSNTYSNDTLEGLGGGAGPTFAPGTIEVHASVDAVFSIR
ncbi:MAG: SIMPL domain-containing protein [Myxococcota bacterium]